jgi:FlaA1/EpsC-like NDP-sugar epimerase
MISKSLSPRLFNAAAPLTDMERHSQPGVWHRMLDWNVFRKTAQFALDMIVFVTAFIFAYLLRFDFNIPPIELFHMAVQLPVVALIQLGALYLLKGHRLIWRYISLEDVYRFVLAALLSAAPVVMLRLTLPEALRQFRTPLSVTVMDSILAFLGALGLRMLHRLMFEARKKQEVKGQTVAGVRKPVLLIGADRTAVMVAREIQNHSVELEVKGFIEDDRNAHGSVIQGIPVLGGICDLPRLARELDVDQVVIAVHASRKKMRELAGICEQIPVRARIIPGLHEIVEGNVQVSEIRDLQIEDLLGREPVQLDEDDMKRFLTGKSVMVTGAGGSIGSELARQVARFQPSTLLLVERAEFSLFNIDREMRERWPAASIVSLVADIADRERMRSIFSSYRPQVVLHAAAHKHVPMMEFNLTEAIKNNVLGTHALGEMAGMSGVEVFVLVSTDKAVRPRSMMGASKRVAELVIQYLNRRFATRYVAVRFGNVIGSNGSVVTIFQEQIRKGGPLTVTHPDMTRYFMTIPEASQLVIQAGTMGEGGEIFILDMGEPVRILDLARDVITLSGLKPYEDIDIVFTGTRPGEKLFEELQTNEESMTKTRHPKIFIGKIAAYAEERVSRTLLRLTALARREDELELRKCLVDLLPEAQLVTESKFDNNGHIESQADSLAARAMVSA